MRNFLIVLVSIFVWTAAHAQFDDDPQKDSCYLRYDAEHNVIRNNRYAEWQCGKLLGVVDCNERLEYDESSDIVYLNNQDRVNAAGANKPFTGTCETCHMNGQLERRINFVNGREDGTDTTTYKSGCPQVVRTHIQGVENGQWLFYYDSTEQLAWEMNYMMGEKHGKHMFYKSNGDTTRWENYRNGLLDGTKRTYYPDSKLKREVEYKMGVMDGAFKIYNLDGVVIEELNYREGKKDGDCAYFYDDGTPLKSENWTMGIKNGEFKSFFYQGAIMVSEFYKKGKKEGWFFENYHDGVTKWKALYKKDVLIEEYRYDEQGRETYSFGGTSNNGAEDDEMPSTKKDKKKKKKDQD
ncbi:MAG: toxin-antitoxin system YwqK family antitoxin [Crocinitomicaceae bacterium]|nr:toxin-antitoxin system YwqK family antitoxin [Crocinitomicaceae bacterium]